MPDRFNKLTELPSSEAFEKVLKNLKGSNPVPVEITGSTYGNVIQNRIHIQIMVTNWLLTYLGIITTVRLWIYGN